MCQQGEAERQYLLAMERGEPVAAGEIEPSFVKVRRFRGANGYPASYGYYLRRAVFEPFGGEPLVVEPADVEECQYRHSNRKAKARCLVI